MHLESTHTTQRIYEYESMITIVAAPLCDRRHSQYIT